MSDESIRSNLRHAGWTEEQIVDGFSLLSSGNVANLGGTVYGSYNTTNDHSSPTLVDSSGSSVGLSGSELNDKKAPNKKKMIKVAMLTIAFFVFLGGSIWGYFLVNPIITKYLALGTLGEIESGYIDGRLVIKDKDAGVDQKQSGLSEVAFLLNGYVDGEEAKTDLTAKMEVPSGYISPEVKLMTVGDKVYFMLTKFPIPEQPGQSQLQDVWYFYGSQEQQDEKNSSQESEGSTSKQGQEITKSFSNAKIFRTFRKITDESVGGVICKQYTFEIDIPKLSELIIKSSSESGQLMTEGEKTKLKQTMQEIMSITGSILIGKEDHMMHRLDVYTEMQDVAIDATLRISEINQKHDFKEPAGAKSFQDTFNIKDQPLPIFSPSDPTRSPI